MQAIIQEQKSICIVVFNLRRRYRSSLGSEIYALCGLGRAEVASGEVVEAYEHFNQTLDIARRIQGWDTIHLPISGLAGLIWVHWQDRSSCRV